MVVTLEDDLEGGPAEETVRFGIGGSEYEIDLNARNAARFRKQLGTFIDHARRAGSRTRRPVRTAASRRRSHDIREWAQQQGIDVSERGRIPARVTRQYDAAVSGAAPQAPARRRGRGGRGSRGR